jgi:two-component system, OmpR family, sensor histidine kinase TctE
MRRRSLQRRVAVRLAMVYMLAIAMAISFFIYQAYNAAGSLTDRQLGLRAADLARYVLVDASGMPHFELPRALAAAYAASESDVFAIRAADGRIIAASPASFGEQVAGWPATAERPSYFRLNNVGEHVKNYYGLSTVLNSAAGPLSITVAHEPEINQLVHTILLGFVYHIGWLIPIFLATTLAIGVLAIRSGLQPLRQVSEMAATIGPNATSIRLPESDLPTELVPLVAAVNHALDRLERGFEVQRDFTANAAHELRTPLTIVTGALDEVTGNGRIDKLKSDVARMNRLVEQLLRVAQLDAIDLDVSETVDLNEIASSLVAMMAPWAVDKDRTLALAISDKPVYVQGNRYAIEDALRNLVENAVAHSPSGEEVTVGVLPNGRMTVADHGPGVPPEQQERIFERFSRGADRVTRGAGLGLAIVSEIMRAHRGTVDVRNDPVRGAIFTLTFARTTDTANAMNRAWDGSSR